MKTKHCPDPAVSRSSVAAVRHASFATYARARAEAEADLEQREQRLNPAVAKSASGSDPTYTIRHDKLMHFKPRDSTDKPSEQPSDANAPLDRSLGDAGRNSPVEGAKPAGKMRQGATGEIPHDNQSQTEHSDPGAKPISKVRKTKSAPSKDQNISDRSGEKVKDARSSSKKATAGKSKQKSQHIGDESAPDGETEPPQ